MLSQFPDWYRRWHLEVNEDELTRHWTALVKIATELTDETLTDLLRKLASLPPKAPQFDEALAIKIQSCGNKTFPTSENSAALDVSAAGILAALFEPKQNQAMATKAGLGIIAAGFLRSKSSRLLPPLEDLAKKHLDAMALRPPPLSLREVKVTVPASPAAAPDPTGERLATLEKAVAALANRLSETNSLLAQESVNRFEESDLLWWILSGHSRIVDTSIRTFGPSDAVIVAVAEASDRTRSAAGVSKLSVITEAVLQQAAIPLSDETSLRQFIEALNITLIGGIGINSSQPGIDLCPVMFAIARWLELDGDASWGRAFPKASHIDLKHALTYRDLARAALHEWLFVKALSGGS